MKKNTIILVDPQINDSPDLTEIIIKLKSNWEITAADSQSEALTFLAEKPFDVIATETNLPDGEAAQLLEKVKNNYPGVLRFILTADTDREQALKLAGIAHQYVTKPCNPEALNALLNNSLGLRKLLADKKLHERIANISSLPVLPEIYRQLVAELQSETASVQKIAALIRKDIATTAKMLQMVNSAFFGLSTHVESPLHAVNLLGLDTVKSLVLSAGVFCQFDDPKVPGFSIESIYNHSLSVGTSARYFANAFGLQKRDSEDALMAGMLHGVGLLLMLTQFTSELRQANELAENEGMLLYRAEREVLGVTHAEIGAHLLSLWGLPDPILEAVALHYHPNNAPSPLLNVLTAVHIAYAFDYDRLRGIDNDESSALDFEYLGRLSLADQIPFLRNMNAAALV